MKIKHFAKSIITMLEKIVILDKNVTEWTKEFFLGTTRDKSFTEPAKLDKKIMKSIYPKGWNPQDSKKYNDWCSTNRVSSVYHIKQTNNVEWK